DAHFRRDRLNSRRRVDGIPREEALAGVGIDVQPDQRLAGVDPDAQPERRTSKRGQAGGVLADPERRADGSLGIVLVRLGYPEDADDGVSDDLPDDSAVRLALAPRVRE